MYKRHALWCWMPCSIPKPFHYKYVWRNNKSPFALISFCIQQKHCCFKNISDYLINKLLICCILLLKNTYYLADVTISWLDVDQIIDKELFLMYNCDNILKLREERWKSVAAVTTVQSGRSSKLLAFCVLDNEKTFCRRFNKL